MTTTTAGPLPEWLARAVAEVGGAEARLTRCVEPYAAFVHPRFAGPSTSWRGLGLADRATYEVAAIVDGFPPHDAIRVNRAPWDDDDSDDEGSDDDSSDDDDGSDDAHDDGRLPTRLSFIASAAGATLGELVDESAAQGARFDTSIAVKVLKQLADTNMQARPHDAVSVDHVLIGFDGSVRVRGHLPWWPRRRRPVVEPGYMINRIEGEVLALFGEVVSALMTSRRTRLTGFALPQVDRAVRDDVRDLLVRLLEGPVLPDVDSMEHRAPGLMRADELKARVDRITRRLAPASDADVGAWVKQVLPARWEAEQRALDLIDGLVTEHVPGVARVTS